MSSSWSASAVSLELIRLCRKKFANRSAVSEKSVKYPDVLPFVRYYDILGIICMVK